MINQEERKRKNNYIHQTNLIKGHSTKEEQNPNYENRKMLINKNKSHSPNNFANYHLPTNGKNIINFKPTKEIASKSQLELKKLTKNEESSGKLIPLKEPQAISINVNIQNMLQSYKRSPNKR